MQENAPCENYTKRIRSRPLQAPTGPVAFFANPLQVEIVILRQKQHFHTNAALHIYNIHNDNGYGSHNRMRKPWQQQNSNLHPRKSTQA